MQAWEGQVLAIAVKELFEAVRTLRLGGDKRELSEIIRDLLSVDPNVNRSGALLDALEARSGSKPSPDLFVAKRLLAAIRKRRLLDAEAASARKGVSLKYPTRPGPIPGGRRLLRPPGSPDAPSVPAPWPRSRSRRGNGSGRARPPDRDRPRRRRVGTITPKARRTSEMPHCSRQLRQQGREVR